MSKLKVLCFSISIDGYGAGTNQGLENPMGDGGMSLHQWVFPTQSFADMHGGGGVGTTGVDNDFAIKGFENIGSWILGRNMFGPIRGEWKDDEWKGWWGANPPYHCDVYVLTNYARKPIVMEGSTTFYFVTDGIHKALELAKKSAGAKDIRLGGGVETVRQYLQKKLIDEMHLAISPIVLGKGENLFSGIDLPALGYEISEYKPSDAAMHIVLAKKN
ncbi:MAG: dihydrofolate reductase family protein [Leptospiraceae bacterium]|nr:dihydrofolate reductase family protein [Leptospiraceae bacterium]